MQGGLSQPAADSPAIEGASPRSVAAARAALATGLVCTAYYAAGAICVALRLKPAGSPDIWLPHGILVAALLAAPVRRWWLYAAALLPTHLHLMAVVHGGLPPSVMWIQYGGNVAQAFLAATVLRPLLGRPPGLDSLSRMGAFIVAGAFLVPCAVVALTVGLVVATGWVNDFWTAWQPRVLGRACGAVIIAAPALHLAAGGLAVLRRARRGQIAELALLTACLGAVMAAIFAAPAGRLQHPWLMLLPLPLLLWSAVRFGPSGLGLNLLVVALVTLGATKAGRGPFAARSVAEVVMALQGFFLAISIPLMLLAAQVRQHARATSSLRESQRQYQTVVEDQTDLICRFRADGTFTFVNGAYSRYHGRSTREMLSQKLWQFLPPRARAICEPLLASLTPEAPVATFEHPVMTPGGDLRWQEWTDRAFFDESGRIVEYQAVGHDVTERKRAEEVVKESEAKVRLFVQHVPAAVAMFDRDMRYLVYSPRWLTDYKLGDQDLAGRNHYEVFPEIPERWKEVHRRCMAGAVEVNGDDSFVRVDGTTDWLRWDVRPWRNARQEIGGIVMFTEVITERKRAEEEHRRLVAQAEVAEALRKVDRRKDEFLATLAHELRNPLAPISLAVEIMRQRPTADDAIIWARDVIGRQTAQLTRLVDDLLDVSRVTLGKITLNLSAVDLRPIIAQAVETAHPLVGPHKQRLSIDVPDQPLPIRGDGARLAQIVSNLLHNAAKFTGDGGNIALAVRRERAHIVLSVKDDGAGIPPDMLGRVFDLFTQLAPPGDRTHDGLGIGLALVKRLVALHGGDIEARSDGPGCGSELIVRFPVAAEAETAAVAPAFVNGSAGPATPDPEREPRPERILVVDDNVDAAEALARVLRLEKHEALVVYDGEAALAANSDMSPDIVLLDIGLPKLDGLEVARRLRAREQERQPQPRQGDVPRLLLVAMTGFGQAQDRARTAAAGFDHHLTKPIDPRALLSLIRAARAKRTGRPAPRRDSPTVSPGAGDET